MSNSGCACRYSCVGLSVVVSIVVGIISAFLTYSAAITLTQAFLWVTLGIGVVYLAITYLGAGQGFCIVHGECLCASLTAILVAILGTIITSLVLLGITFAATSIVGALISGLLLGFLTLIFTSVSCYIICKAACTQ